ncbi:NBS-LRR type resistance protein [Cucumis melo var. makuwa]|uniref:NBS-LRR type resistance protein n=1 Tax=Cucumis melo var. makuwa TaxID=1194695 RepID=A0A5D3DDZ3_CUCMM|nr:NBS-LRR type resistance protein [Cucumis melo var. makuwa]
MAFTHPSCLSSVCPSRYLCLKKIKSKGFTYQSSDPEGYTYQSSDPEGCTYQSSYPEGYSISLVPEGYMYQSSDPEGCTYQSSDPEGYISSSDPEGNTCQSSDPEGCTYQSRNLEGHRACKLNSGRLESAQIGSTFSSVHVTKKFASGCFTRTQRRLVLHERRPKQMQSKKEYSVGNVRLDFNAANG